MPPHAIPASARHQLRGLTHTLATVSSRLETQGHTADEVALLVTRAEALAERARALATLPYPAGGTFASLASEIDSFGGAAAAVAAKAVQEAQAARHLASDIRARLVALQAAAQRPDGDEGDLRAPLEGVLGAIAPLPGRLQAVASLAADVSGLGGRAADMSERNGDARGNTRLGASAALALVEELRGFAEAASAASEGMLADNYGIRQVMTVARDQAGQIGGDLHPASGAPRPAPQANPPHPPAPRAMVWQPRPFGRRHSGA